MYEVIKKKCEEYRRDENTLPEKRPGGRARHGERRKISQYVNPLNGLVGRYNLNCN